MATSIIALLLLLERLTAAGFLIAVIVKQIRQILTTATEYSALRITLMLLTVVVLMGQFVPILFDATVMVQEWGDPDTPDALIISYTASNATASLLVSILLFVIYYRRNKNSR